MAYKKSKTDKDNFKWFEHDSTRASLCSINLSRGKIRGLTSFRIDMKYPITVFSGGNGSGKSTILALAACAFHNTKEGFIPSLRTKSYYTFFDFFVQSNSENPVEGVEIRYGINHNSWKSNDPGIRYQSRKKSKGGKWNDYSRRVRRNVIYFGVQRVVPHYERSTHKSYRSKFKPGNMPEETRKKVSKIAGKIIGKNYSDFDSYTHTKYTLPVASANGISYSGFNMGAGEAAIFEIISALFSSGPGTLLVIDEIELGLHEIAQVRLIEELKKLCLELKCQIICSTHSHPILRNLPSEARFHIESVGSKTFITPGVSPDFACRKMGKPDAHELDIFVEDKVAVELLQVALPASIRKRVRIKSIGSHSAVIRQLSSRKLEGIDNCICILDGDQNGSLNNAINIAQSACETSTPNEKENVKDWISERIFYLPGSNWPEKWIIEQSQHIVSNNINGIADQLIQSWGFDNKDQILLCLEEAAGAKKHSEFYDLSIALDFSEQKTRSDLISFVVMANIADFDATIKKIEENLP